MSGHNPGQQDIAKMWEMMMSQPQSTNLWPGAEAKGFGMNTGTLGGIGKGIGALGDLASIYFGKQGLDLAEDQFNTNKAFSNRNIANQSKTINNDLEARYRAGLASRGDRGPKQESVESYMARSRVDGSAIG